MNEHTESKSCPVALQRHLFVAPRTQSRILLKVTLYCLLSSVLPLGISAWLTSASGSPVNYLQLCVAAGVTTCLVLPLALVDTVVACNRVLGPLWRVQGVVRRLAAGDPVQTIQTRAQDEWQDWIQEFNQLVNRLENSDTRPSKSTSDGSISA